MVDPGGATVWTHDDVMAGQEVFLRNGLMEYGSIFGHGAYLGPDYTAEYLHNAALFVRERYGGPESDNAVRRTVEDFQTNRYDDASDTLEFTEAQAAAFRELRGGYGEFFSNPTTEFGLRPGAITDPDEIHALTAYFSWSAWTAAARRPGHDYSYTNSWPPEPLVDNKPTANVIVWSVLSLAALLGGIGLLFAAFGRWNFGTGGFRFHPHLDAWQCPQGEYLHLHEHDRERRLIRYRARPLICNACPAKPECTDSHEGREIVRSLNDWPRSESGTFHRVISLSLVVLAAMIPAVVLVRHHDPVEVALLASVVLGAACAARRLAGALRGPASDPNALA